MRLDALPRQRLARLPTPLHEAARLRDALGGRAHCPRILLKRDDLTDLALGGNKARKLEFILPDARARGATVLVTTGGPQSNHARMTAAAASLAGMRAVLVLTGDHGGGGNLVLDNLLGAETYIVPDEAAESAKLAAILDELRRAGERPFVVPLGGSCALGAIGYVLATREILQQLEADNGPPPDRLYHASGSRGTQAGLELGARLFSAPWRVTGVAVSGGEVEKRDRAARIIAEAASLLDSTVEFDASELQTEQKYFGAGYGVPTREGTEAIRMLARTEGIFLDPVYTAKAMAGLIDHVRSGRLDPEGSVLFLHTGGVPALFALPGARTH